MISQNSISAVAPIVDKITTNRKVARPLSGTPLESLCMLKEPLGVLANDNADGGAISDICNCDTEEHNAAMEYVVGLSTSAVQNVLFNAKNVVVPMIQQLVDGYEKYVSATVNGSANNVIVKPVFSHDIWNNPVVLSMVEKYDGVPLTKVNLTLMFPVKSAEELAEFIKTGSTRFDAEMADYLDGLSKQFGYNVLDAVYKNVFSFEAGKNYVVLDDYINPFSGQRENAMVTLLLAARLMTNVPDGIEMSLIEYQAYVSAIVEQAGRAVMRAIQTMESDLKNKTLISTYPSIPFGNPYIESVIQVNGKVYNQWLAEGGSPEVLFGAYATSQERGYTTLLDNKEDYLRAWDREKKIIEAKVRFEMRSIRSTALRKAFFDVIKDLPEDQKRLPAVDMVKLSDMLIDNMDDKAFEYIYKYARKLICRSAFPGTDFEDFLKSIDAAAEANPGIDEREAALLATIEYVSKWVASQVVCVSY